MPLVFVVLVMMVIAVSISESKKKNSDLSSMRSHDMRKTNACMERKLVDDYIKQGMSFEDSYHKSASEMIRLGYEPCIPKDAYQTGRGDVITPNFYTSKCSYKAGQDVKNFDSYSVRTRRGAAQHILEGVYGRRALIPKEEEDALTYANFPRNEAEYVADLNRCAIVHQSIHIGTLVHHTKLGTCRVDGYNNIKGRIDVGSTYKLTVLKTGEVVNNVAIGDKNIQCISG